jgi:uncharacterized protein (TIGR04255 family)
MPFPESPRIIYKKNPLDRVICQLRFPPILKIDTETPAQFQECIRGNFPEFRLKEEATLLAPAGIPQELHAEMLRQITPSEIKNYEFSSEDSTWKVNLTRTFLSLSTKKYIRRSDFQEHLSVPLKSLIDIYKPAYFTRVGLRYIDVIKRSQLHLADAKWKELLKPFILGLSNESNIENEIQTAECQYEVRLPEFNSTVRIAAGLVSWEKGNNEECFKIDSDFSTTEKTAVSDVIPKLDFFHTTASRLIQWLIQPKLHVAMEPENLP